MCADFFLTLKDRLTKTLPNLILSYKVFKQIGFQTFKDFKLVLKCHVLLQKRSFKTCALNLCTLPNFEIRYLDGLTFKIVTVNIY